MKITVIQGDELTDDQVRRWSELQLADPDLVSGFFRPEFAQAVASARRDVFVAVLEDAGRVAGFFPFQRERWGVGKPLGGNMSDYHGLIAERSLELDPAALLRACGLRLWRFNHLLASQRTFAPYHAQQAASPFLDLSGGFEAYKAARSAAGSKVIAQADRKARKLSREIGDLRFDVEDADPAALRELISWKSAQYRRTGAPDLFQSKWRTDLVERIMATRTPEFAGVLSTLRAGDRLVAAHFGIRSRTALHWWFPAYDAEFGRFSPGLVLLVQLARNAELCGAQMLDLGRGDDSYKVRLMSGSVPLAEGAVAVTRTLAAGHRLRGGVERVVRRSTAAEPARHAIRWVRRQRARSAAGRA